MIHLHEKLDGIVDETVDGLVPVSLWVVVERREHDWQNDWRVLGDKRHDVVIVPVVERTLGDLEVRRAHALGYLSEERNHDFLELGRLDDVENLFQLVEEHDFFRTVRLWPELQEAPARSEICWTCHGELTSHLLYDRLRQTRILLEELDDAIGQLGMVNRQTFHLMQGQKGFQEESFVLLFERQCEAINNRAEDLEQLSHTIVMFRFVNESTNKRFIVKKSSAKVMT